MNLNWISDICAEVSVLGVPTKLKEIEFKGDLRITLEPLITDVPIVGNISICFLEPPFIDFNFDGAGAIVNAPGVEQGIKKAIGSVMESMLVLPKRIDIPLTDKLTCDIKFR